MFLILLKDVLLYVIFLVMADLLLINSPGWQVAESEVKERVVGRPLVTVVVISTDMLACPWSQGLDLWGIKPQWSSHQAAVLATFQDRMDVGTGYQCGYPGHQGCIVNPISKDTSLQGGSLAVNINS